MLTQTLNSFSLVAPGMAQAMSVPSRSLGAPLWDTAGALPSLDLNLAQNKSLLDSVTGQSLVTFTRTSTGTYFDSSGVLQTAATNEARFDHNPTTGESLGLLVEEARTNNLTYSEDTSQWLTPTNITLSQNQTVAPDGASTADQYLETVTNGLHAQSSSGFLFVTGTTYTYSVFVKSIGGRNFTIGFPPTVFSARFANFNLSGIGTVVSTDVGVTADIKAYPNGWYRCLATSACVSGSGSRVDNFITNSSYSISYAGDVTKGLFIWGAQLETGAFPTSYIPTTSATVTRAADVASITGSNFSSWYNQTEGTVFASGDFIALGAGSFSRIIGFGGTNAGTDEISFHTRVAVGTGDGSIFGAVTVNSSLEGDLNAPAEGPNFSGAYRSALAYKANDFGLSSNGLTPTTDTSGTLPTITQLIIMGSLRFQNRLSGHVRRISFWPTRLANTTLQQITL